MIVEITDEAEGDLERIADYIARDNPRRGLAFIQELRISCLELADTPEGFTFVPRYEHQGIRRKVHSNYLIFYRVQDTRIIVIHVLHGATDYAGVLFAS